MNIMDLANMVDRSTVVAKRDGFIEGKEYGDIIGLVRRDVNAAGKTIWRAQAGDVGSFDFTRDGAIQRVIDLHNMQEKARLFDLMQKRSEGNQQGQVAIDTGRINAKGI